jgi:biopolymer transport protein ExbB
VVSRIQAKDYAEVKRLCERRPCAFADLVLAALAAFRGVTPGAKPPVGQAVETAGSHLAERLQGAVDWLADLAAIAPLVGLLGTVLGMFRAFGGIATDVAAGAKPVVLAQGVSQAIVTTIFGLAIAIPCLLFHAYFRRRAMRRIAEIEELAQ